MSQHILRKVLYRIDICPSGHYPGKTQHDYSIEKGSVEEKIGWFQAWTQIAVQDSHSSNIIIETRALIETEEGRIIMIPHSNFIFTENPE